MNLYLLVEGQKTEKDVYRSWLKHAFPELRPAATMAEMTGNAYYILSGYGVPSYIRRIHDALEDIRDTPSVDHFFVCVDAEELTYEARYEEVAREIARQEVETQARRGNPSFRSHVIVQSCCIETWFLGHRKMMRKSPSSPILAEYRRFYDVREDDPERMEAHPEFRTRAQFHLAYLKEMLLDQSPRLSPDPHAAHQSSR